MKTFLLIATIVLALLHSPPQSPADSGTVEGIVRNADTREPIEGVEVTLKGQYERPAAAMLHAVRTDSNGRFILRDVAPGSYRLLKQRSGYLSPNGDAWWESEIQMDPRQRLTGLVLELIPTSSISGRVFSADGEPVAGIQVAVSEPAYRHGVRGLDRGTSATTDEQGRYRLFGLLPGEYYLLAEYTPIRPGLPSNTVLFPGTFDESAARPVVVPPGAELSGMDFVFPTPSIAPTFTITGVIRGVPAATDRNSVPSLRLTPRDGYTRSHDPRLNYSTPSARANGQFQIRGVRAGMYDLYSQAEDDKRNLFTSETAIDVQSNIENLEITMRRGVDVRVRITVNGLAPAGALPDTDPDLSSVDEVLPSYYSALFPILEGYKADRNSGEYTLPQIPPGRYRLNYLAYLLEGGYIADILQNGRSVFDEGFTVGNERPDPLEMAISTSGGIVEGEVRDTLGNFVPPARVLLVPLPARRNNPLLFRMDMSGKDGQFRIRNVAPGLYKVFAWASPPFGEPWRNAEFMRRYEERGQAAQVEVNKAVSVRVTVIPKAGL